MKTLFTKFIGVIMSIYRASPFYPWCGKILARCLSFIAPGSPDVITRVNGIFFALDLREVIDSSLYYSGSFEPRIEHIIASIVRPGMVAIDVGANIGYHTFSLAKHVGPQGLVIAVEPTSYAFEKLRRNLSLNDFPQIRLVKAGLAEMDAGEMEVIFRSSYRLDGKDEVFPEIARLLTLDSLVRLQCLDRVDFVKIDVDGSESEVFAGAHWLLASYRPSLIFEFGPVEIRKKGRDPKELLRLLWSFGYRLSTDRGRATPDVSSVLRAVQPGVGYVNLVAIPADTK